MGPEAGTSAVESGAKVHFYAKARNRKTNLGVGAQKIAFSFGRFVECLYFCIEIITKAKMIRLKKEVVAEMLREKGVAPTPPRVAIYKQLKEQRSHYTVDKIYSGLKRTMPHLSKTSVYNTLHMMADMGLCGKLTINAREFVFDSEPSPHAHFVCKHCGEVLDVPGISEQIPQVGIEGYTTDEVDVYYRGTCCSCNYRISKEMLNEQEEGQQLQQEEK